MKRIIVDFDGTLALGVSPNIEDLKPNTQLIEKLNKWGNAGYEIIVETARGQLSCGGDVILAGLKYRKIIERLLIKWGLYFDKLSFNKKLADIYIDDRSMQPLKFITMEEPKVLKGLSGDNVIKIGDRVFKDNKNGAEPIVEWFSSAKKHGFNVPEIYSVVGDKIEMEFIDSFGSPSVESMIELIGKFKSIPTKNNSNFESYITRVLIHLEKNGLKYENIIGVLKSYSNYMDMEISFNHGDFNPDNVIEAGGVQYLIDPIQAKNLYSSWIIDYTKLLFYYINIEDYSNLDIAWNSFNIPQKLKQALVSSHMIRVMSYLKSNKKIEKLKFNLTQIEKFLD